ncbi:hypothetical protein [Streptomyces auratus]|uniref:Uncharacterized protein n=1 Tax=Streptomyces auratus AGR0001 TaxID=1160718 RepID=A0A8B1P0X7_9ACTN|nr:hypothetical protein [Streptomyces auratus]QTZ95757.1 hypothetical protein SU9_033435 [Streptomyces auratus AGR0001]
MLVEERAVHSGRAGQAGDGDVPVASQHGIEGFEDAFGVGEIGDIGADTSAAHAAEADGAVVAAGGDVGRLGAQAVGDLDFADRATGVFGIEQDLSLAPDTVAVPVDLHGGDPVDGLPSALRGDAVIRLCGLHAPVIHQIAQDIGRHSGVGVPLAVGVPVGVEEDLGLVEGQVAGDELAISFDAGGDQDLRQGTHPLTVALGQPPGTDGFAAVGGGWRLRLRAPPP